MSLKRDEGAPIEVMKAEKASFEERSDIKMLRAQIRDISEAGTKKQLYNQLYGIIDSLSRQLLSEKRKSYFDEADELRRRGIEPEPRAVVGVPGAAAGVARLLVRPDKPDESVSERYIEALVRYLAPAPPNSSQPGYGRRPKLGGDIVPFYLFRIAFQQSFWPDEAFPGSPPRRRHVRSASHLSRMPVCRGEGCCLRPGAVVQPPQAGARYDPHAKHQPNL